MNGVKNWPTSLNINSVRNQSQAKANKNPLKLKKNGKEIAEILPSCCEAES